MTLAQIPNVDPKNLQDFVVLLSVLVGLVATAVGGFIMLRKAGNTAAEARVISPQPLQIESVAKLVTRDQCEALHMSLADHLARHEKSIESLWGTVRTEHTKIREEMNRAFKDIDRTLGRIEGKLETRNGDLLVQITDHIERKLNERDSS